MYLIYITLMILLLLPVFQSDILTWREQVRILIVLITLSLLYNRFFPLYKRSFLSEAPNTGQADPQRNSPVRDGLSRIWGSRHSPVRDGLSRILGLRQKLPKTAQAPLAEKKIPRYDTFLINPHRKKLIDSFRFLASIILIFIVSQFNPATAGVARDELSRVAGSLNGNPPRDLNWFFVVSTILILTGFLALLIHVKSFKKANSDSVKSIALEFRKVDGFVVILIFSLIVMGFFSNLLLSENPGWDAFAYSAARLTVFLLIWFYIHVLFGVKINHKNYVSFFHPTWVRRAFIVILLSFSIILVTGIVRFISVYKSYAQSNEYFQREDFNDALIAYENTLEKNRFLDFKPITNSTLENIASIYAKFDSTEKFNETIQLYNENNKGNEKINSNLGKIYFHAGKFDLAKLEFEEFLFRRQYEENETVELLGRIYLREKDLSGIVNLIDRYNVTIDRDGLNEEEYLLMGNAYFEHKDFQVSLDEFQKALSFNPENAYTYYKLGRIYQEMKNFVIAIEQFTTAVSLDSSFADAYYYWGLSLEKLDRKDEALEKFKKTVEVLPNHYNGLRKLEEYKQIN